MRDFHLREKDYGIRSILIDYHNSMERIKPLEKEDWYLYDEQREFLTRLYEQAFKVLATSDACTNGELFLVSEFRDDQERGGFIPYDGFGVYLDWDGNELGDVNWNPPYSVPNQAVFVAWYNK